MTESSARARTPQAAATAPAIAALVMVLWTFLDLGLAPILPDNLFLVLFAGMILVTAVWLDRTPNRLHGIGPVGWVFALYLLWNLYSMLAPHEYPASDPLTGDVFSVPRFLMTGVILPFVMLVVGRYTFERPSAVRLLLWMIVLMAGYSAAVSIMQFTGPTAWVWPRFIVDGSLVPGVDTWADRAIGVFNQPVVNGMTMLIGFAVAMLLISTRSEPVVLRFLALAIAIASGIGVYFTHTRAVWLSGAVMLLAGALLAKGFRKGFVISLGVVAAVVAANWSNFTSSDRNAGGVGSTSEVNDRLNIIQTALWAVEQNPLTGWGIQRFQAINTYHHQQWSKEIPWGNGFGIVSHTNEMGVLAELGLIGFALWVSVLLLAAYRLWVAHRALPDGDLCGKPLVITASIAFVVLFCSGLTVDLRLFDFPTAIVFLLVGTAIGWGDRARLNQAAPDDVGSGSLSRAHV
ncbi:O-antigen ligase family protein [Mycobacterium neglectum]|uniref:O-antigen ligase family protein n=1 Tax=Mycobacterium neglectum TaxID=242737 RepID=UPI000BFF0684|nr:O-antigen ligase family protein [Mycobacterium neglectum]